MRFTIFILLLFSAVNILVCQTKKEPLLTAIDRKQTDLAQKLIQKGANIEARTPNHRYTPLMLAVKKGNFKLVKFLAAHGANVDARDYKIIPY